MKAWAARSAAEKAGAVALVGARLLGPVRALETCRTVLGSVSAVCGALEKITREEHGFARARERAHSTETPRET